MKLLWRLGKEAIRYRFFYFVAIFSTLALTLINLIAPKLMTSMTNLVEAGEGEDYVKLILSLTFILLALYLMRFVFRYFSNYLAHKAAWHLVEDIRVKLYDHIQNLSMSFFHDKQTGDLMSRVINDTATFELLYAHIIPDMLTNTLTVFGVSAILLTINYRLALLTFIPIPLILVSGWVYTKKVRPNFQDAQRLQAQMNAKLQDNFSGIHEIQAFSKETYEADEVLTRSRAYTKVNLHALQLSGLFHPFVEFVSSLGSLIVVGIGGVFAFKWNLSLSDIIAFLLYLSLFYGPISSLARMLEDMQIAYAGAERVMAILDTKTEIIEKTNPLVLEDVKGHIVFENVSFKYNTGGMVVEDISFECKPGQMVALVGPTGVGKTTLTQLISRFYDPVKGRISLDGVDIQDISLDNLRSNISPVLQDTFLFNGTIEENIAYAKADATQEEIIAAAKAARIHDAIMLMPQRYQTQVGERGLRLSGGQKQRLAIARAILRDSPIIILDEATASVDVETEKEIQEAIASLAGKRTIIAIAHRLTTIQNADLILVLEEGRIVERGSHQELIASGGPYARLQKATY